MKKMTKACAVLLAVLSVSLAASAFAGEDNNNVRWDQIVGNITVSDNDAVGGILHGPTPWSTTGGRAHVNLATGRVSFDVDGLVLNGGNATGTPDGVNQVESSLICDAGQKDQTIFTTTPVPLNAQGNADFSGTFNTIPGTCTNPLFLIRIGPDLPGANQRWIATGAVRSFGASHGPVRHVRSRQNSPSTSVTTKSVPKLTGSIKMKGRKSNEKNEKSMCSVTRSVVRCHACLSVRRRAQQTQGGKRHARGLRP